MSSSPKRRERLVSNLDLISNLPEDIIDTIILHLSIMDVVRTSILSKKRRYKWVTNPQIVFNERYYSPGVPFSNKTLLNLKRVNIVDQVLLHHRGPIHTFKFSYYLHVSSASTDGYFSYPDEMYHLRLESAIFNIPLEFEVFRRLKVLDLHIVIFPNEELEFLISKSPLIESFTLGSLVHPNRLKINAPNLRYLYLFGLFEVLSFESTLILASAFIYIYPRVDFSIHLEPGASCIFTKVLKCLCNVEKLDMKYHFLKVLASGGVPKRPSSTFNHLKNLSLNINFENPKQILAAISMLRTSYNLQVVESSSAAPATKCWKAQTDMDCMLNHLRSVKMRSIFSFKPELEFLEMLLMNSPAFERLTIENMMDTSMERKAMIIKELLRFRRASGKVEIIYLNEIL
ncbi:F-box/FBD/LRR-repeat protein At1g13570-like [Tasmannia lanceolata]|uniref:F-box/FBD/LRR-repeat protein At1g13570-like n=1 Tax=Tasmannia lanceolata TaxID=3420 RepID=UPI00406289FC